VEQLQIVCDFIILIGGAFVAINTILNWLGKPIKIVRKKTNEELTEKIKQVFNEMVPGALEEHDKKTKKVCVANRDVCL
jgi:hypothetical protein